MADEGDTSYSADSPSRQSSKAYESDVGTSGRKSSNGGSPERTRSGRLVNSADKAAPVFQQMTSDTNGKLPKERIEDFLIELGLSTDYEQCLESIVKPGAEELSLEEA